MPTGHPHRGNRWPVQILVLAHGSPARTDWPRWGDFDILGKVPQTQGCLGLGHTAQGPLSLSKDRTVPCLTDQYLLCVIPFCIQPWLRIL